MRNLLRLAVTVAALVVTTAAGDAPIVRNQPMGDTYQAVLPNNGGITGAIKGSSAPNGVGTFFQVAFYNLPHSGRLSYMIHTDRVSNDDCSTTGPVLDPYGGIVGSTCFENKASCQVGDLSVKHGTAKISKGGAATGYFARVYVDDYISMQPGSEAFFGNGSVVISNGNGLSIACANFIDADASLSLTSSASMPFTSSASASTTSPTSTLPTSSTMDASSAVLVGGAARTAAPIVGAGVLGLAAVLI